MFLREIKPTPGETTFATAVRTMPGEAGNGPFADVSGDFIRDASRSASVLRRCSTLHKGPVWITFSLFHSVPLLYRLEISSKLRPLSLDSHSGRLEACRPRLVERLAVGMVGRPDCRAKAPGSYGRYPWPGLFSNCGRILRRRHRQDLEVRQRPKRSLEHGPQVGELDRIEPDQPGLLPGAGKLISSHRLTFLR
jgi:hypothetical protein